MLGFWLPTSVVIGKLYRDSHKELEKGLKTVEVGIKLRDEELIKIGVQIVRSAASWMKYTKVGFIVLGA